MALATGPATMAAVMQPGIANSADSQLAGFVATGGQLLLPGTSDQYPAMAAPNQATVSAPEVHQVTGPAPGVQQVWIGADPAGSMTGSTPVMTMSAPQSFDAAGQSVQSGSSTLGDGVGDLVPAFAQKWGLNAGAVQWLYTVDPGLRATIITQFAPRCDAKDTSRMLFGFGRSIAARMGVTASALPPLQAPQAIQTRSAPPADPASYPAGENTESVESFAQRWGLDAPAVEWLRSLDPLVAVTVMAEFSPQSGEALDAIVQKLYAFGRSVASRHAAGAAMPSELRAFAQRWSLDGPGLNWLLALPPMVQGVVVREFAPHGDCLDILSKLRAFARSVEAKMGGLPQQAHTGPRQSPAVGADRRVREFVAYWNLDETAQAALYNLTTDVQASVIDQFDPKGDMTNLNRKFMAFVRTVSRHAATTAGTAAAAGFPVAAAGTALPAQGTSVASTPLLDGFVAHWGLSSEAKDFLCSLSPAHIAEVIERFDPAGSTKDINRKLIGFAKSVASGARPTGFQSHAWPPMAAGGSAKLNGAPGLATGCGGGGATEAALPSADEATFLARWGLDSIPSARDFLLQLPPDVKAQVIQDFAPKPGTRDVLRLFMGFVNSVSRKLHGDASYRGAGSHTFHAAPNTAVAVVTDASLAPAGFPAGFPAADAGATFGMEAPPSQLDAGTLPSSVPPAVLGAGASLAAAADIFAEQWRLDEGSKALLRGLPEEARRRVITEFNPRGPILDIGGKFCAFARSIASAVAAEQQGQPMLRGVKRAAEWSAEAVHQPSTTLAMTLQ